MKQTLWSVTPDSIRLGLADTNTPAAYFLSKDEAQMYAYKYGDFAITKQVTITIVEELKQ